jgi:hypothetical protein
MLSHYVPLLKTDATRALFLYKNYFGNVTVWKWKIIHLQFLSPWLSAWIASYFTTLYQLHRLFTGKLWEDHRIQWTLKGGEKIGTISVYYPGILLEVLWKTMKNLSQDCRCAGRGSNPGTTEYKSETLQLEPTYTIYVVFIDWSKVLRCELIAPPNCFLRDFSPFFILDKVPRVRALARRTIYGKV